MFGFMYFECKCCGKITDEGGFISNVGPFCIDCLDKYDYDYLISLGDSEAQIR